MRTALIYNFLIEANLMASIAIVLMILVRAFGRKRLGSRAIYIAWLLVAARLLIPLALPNPVIHEIRSAFSQDTAIRPIAGQIQVRFGDAVNHLYDKARLADSPLEMVLRDLRDDAGNGMLSIQLMKLYITGAAAVIGWFVWRNWRFRKLLLSNRGEPISGLAQEQYQAICKEMKLKPLPVYFVDRLPGTCLVGCIKPYIALPLTAEPQPTENMLRHELRHYKNKDHWWCLVRLVCCVVHWFNPLVWLAAHMSRMDSELACDEHMICSMNEEDRRDYAGELMLTAAKRDLPSFDVLSTGMSMTDKRLQKRVSSIGSNHQAHKGLALGFLVLASMALVGAFATAEMPFLGRIPDAYMEFRTSTVTESTVEMTDAEKQDVIEQAKVFWRSEALAADVHDHLEWSVQAYLEHVEVHAYDPDWGEALILAFAPDGRILYFNNRRSGDREAISSEDKMAMLSQDQLKQVKEYALAVLEEMEPGLKEKLGELTPSSHPTKSNGKYFYRFFSYQGDPTEHQVAYVFNVQTYPQVRLTHYENLLEMDDDASDRLEPGNG